MNITERGDIGSATTLTKPELRNTSARTSILVHPGHGFLASIGCINLTDRLDDGSVDIPFADSRDRVVAVIDDLKDYLGDAFPHRNGIDIPHASVEIIDR